MSCLLFSHSKNLCISNAAVHKLSDPTEREKELPHRSLIPPFSLFLPHSHPTAAPPTRTQSRCIFFHLSRLHPLHHSASFLALSFSAPSWIFFFLFFHLPAYECAGVICLFIRFLLSCVIIIIFCVCRDGIRGEGLGLVPGPPSPRRRMVRGFGHQ